MMRIRQFIKPFLALPLRYKIVLALYLLLCVVLFFSCQRQYIAELVSLGLTFPTVILAIAVVITWGPSALRSIRERDLNEQDWFILGVVIGFLGSIMDNIYWSLPWSAAFLDHPLFSKLTVAGVYFNIFFRQSSGIVAAYCHLKAAELASNRHKKRLNHLLVSSHLLGLAYAALLILARAA